MATMGSFCKAYPVQRLREFAGWKENTEALIKQRSGKGDNEIVTQKELTENDHLYLQENFTVTDSISLAENIIFDEVTPEWIDFCQNRLKFQVPVYEPVPGLTSKSEAGAQALTPALDAELLH
jgi:hypothetical protein